MVIAAPLAYLAASYYNGEDGIQNIKDLLGIDQKTATETPAEQEAEPAEIDSSTTTLDMQQLQETVEQLKEENQQLMDSLREQGLQIQELKREIRILKGSQGD